MEIESLAVIAGRLRRREAVEPLAWARENREMLRAAWKERRP
ncbi:MAG: DUF4160 domain-containing protein [Deferrisomatales bacterium]